MKIAVSYAKFATSQSGGARESLLTLLNGVSEEKNIFIDVYQTPPIDDLPDTKFEYSINSSNLQEIPKLTWTNQVISRFQWGRYLRQHLSSDYDLLITLGSLGPISVRIANDMNIPSIFFIHSMALTGYEKYCPNYSHIENLLRSDFGGKVQYPFLRKNFYDYKHAANDATQTIANSKFTASRIMELFGTNSSIIYPPIKADNYKVPYNKDGFITMVNPRTIYKGPDIFLNIANQLSQKEFLLVGPIGPVDVKKRVKEMSNVTHWEWCENMRNVYSESKVVVIPSRVEESFGRVAAEAMVSGIPCVVSDRGGLPEVVGETGEIISSIESAESWIRGINQALERHQPEAQQERVKMFFVNKQAEKLIKLIEQICMSK